MNRDFTTAFMSPDFEMNGAHLIAASAGTGKTYNIQNIFGRLVFERGISPRDILVVTFTEAATAELRDRLRRILRDLNTVLSHDEPSPELFSEYPQAAELVDKLISRENRPLCRERIINAISEFDQAQISTIHGFCQRTLKRHAFESGFLFTAEVGGTDDSEFKRITADYWRTHKSELENCGATYAELIDFAVKRNAKPDAGIAEITGENKVAIQALFDAAGEIADTCKQTRFDRELLTYDDLLRGVRDALHGSKKDELIKAVRTECKAALIDEFQDTDPVQYEIFKTFFIENPEPCPVFLVGDPKQAIYSFRGGDIYTYLSAVDDVPEENRFLLSKNFRSTAKIVDAVNLIFEDAYGAGSTFGGKAMEYTKVQANGKTPLFYNGSDEKQPFVLHQFEDDENGKSPKETAILSGIVKRISEMLSGCEINRGGAYVQLRPDDIAVLVQTKATGRNLRNMLVRGGIRAVCRTTDEKVTETNEAKMLLTVLTALQKPSYSKALSAAALTPLIGITPDEMNVLVHGGRFNCSDKDGPHFRSGDFAAEFGDSRGDITFGSITACFTRCREIWIKQGMMTALAALRKISGFDLRTAAMPNGERILTNFEHVSELVNNATSEGSLGIAETTDWLKDAVNGRFNMNEADEIRLDSDEDAVTIMTIHKSKGLEFPVVMIPLSLNKRNQNRDRVLSCHPDDDSCEVLFCKTAAAGNLTEKHCGEENLERLRQLYVAFTRAALHCEVFFDCPKDNAGSAESGDLIRRIYDQTKENEASGTEFPIRTAEAKETLPGARGGGPDRRKSADLHPVQEPFQFAAPWDHGSYSSLMPHDDTAGLQGFSARETARDADREPSAGSDAQTNSEPVFSAFKSGAKTGTAWHELFEKISFQAGRKTRLLQTGKILRSNGLLSSADETNQKLKTDVAVEMQEAVLNIPLNVLPGFDDSGSFRLIDVPDCDRVAEWEFDFHPDYISAGTDAVKNALKRHWAGDPGKSAFLERIAEWDRRLPAGWMVGFVDLLFRKNGRYYIVDWKSNSIGGRPENFTREGILNEMAQHCYFLQYLLYSAVVHSYLKETLPGYSYNENFGGIAYIFLRGAVITGGNPGGAVYEDRPCEKLLDDLAAAFGIGDGQ